MTADQFISGIEKLGAVERRAQPGGQILAVLDAQPVPGTGRRSRVAFTLTNEVQGRPQHFVDADMRTRSGGVPTTGRRP